MNPILIGDTEAHEKLTARVYFLRDGDPAYCDLGNVKEYNEAHEYAAVTRVVAEKGYRRTSDEQLDVVTAAWEFTLDELDAPLIRALKLGTQGANVEQAAAPAPTGSTGILNCARDVWYNLGAFGVSEVVAKIPGVGEGEFFTLPTAAYVLDTGAGKIKFVNDLVVGVSVTLTYGKPAVTFEAFTGLDSPQTQGFAQIFEYNQFSEIPLRVTECRATLRATEFPTQSGEFGTYKLRLTALSKPVIKRRGRAL